MTSHDPYALTADEIRSPPHSLWSALKNIGPGIILAGSIIGSGELLLTTSLGATYGFVFLWLILFSCVIKVFVQIELGRYAISSGKPTLAALDELPGPRLGAHWLVWWWFIMLLATVFQLGAMVGGVGQALHLAFPGVTEKLADLASTDQPGGQMIIKEEPTPAEGDRNEVDDSRDSPRDKGPITGVPTTPEEPAKTSNGKQRATTGLAAAIRAHPEHPWAVLTALVAVGLLLSGGYKSIERITTVLVAGVTLVTVICVLMLPGTGYAPQLSDFRAGFSLELFALPAAAIAAAFSTFGITGVGASELYSYPYWCLEKGYARFTGPRAEDSGWAERARGWLRVMYLDAWVSMIVFTVATVAFYILGATVLHKQGLHPEKSQMIATLSEMYVPAFGDWTKIFFLIGVWAVLFKTLYVASASHSRLTTDFLGLIHAVQFTQPETRGRWIRRFCVFYPLLALVLYLFVRDPKAMVIIGGFFQAATLPIISGAAVYLRYRRTDKRLAPSGLSDACLWFAFVTITAVALYAIPQWAKNDLWPLVRPLLGGTNP